MNHPLSFLSRTRQLPWAITIPKNTPWDITVPKSTYIVVPNTPRDIKVTNKHHGILRYQKTLQDNTIPKKAPWDITMSKATIGYYNTNNIMEYYNTKNTMAY